MYPVMVTMGAGDQEIAILRIIDWDRMEILAETQYRSELSCFMEKQKNTSTLTPRCKFNGGSFFEDMFFICTYNEIVVYKFDCGFKLVRSISRPTFADLHHVHCEEGRLKVVITGLDIVEEIDLKGNLIKQYFVADDVQQRYDLEKDFRRVTNTKPHTSHPSWLTQLDGRYLVTLQRQRQVVDLETGEFVVNGFPGHIHDGTQYGDYLYYTTTNGYVVCVTLKDMKIKKIYHTYPFFGKFNPGWFRGLCVKNDHRLIVGLYMS